jgi:predicted nucleotidyltransferase
MVAKPEFVTPILRRFVEEAARCWHLERVYLYGSYAGGTPNDWSDIDVAVISPDFTNRTAANIQLVHLATDVSSSIEPRAFRPEDFADATPSDFCFEIKRTGAVIYDAELGGLVI